MVPTAAMTEETRAVLAKMILDAQNDVELQKTISVATGLVGVDLQAPAKQLVPLLSPFRGSIPRATRVGANVTQWKAITALSQPKATTAENAAAAVFATTVTPKTATYKVVGLRGKVTREAVAASEGFDPALAKETANTLLLAMKLEEMQILGGNITALATPGAPTVTERNGLGSLAALTYYVRIAALTLPAANRVSLDRPADYDGTDAFLAGRQVATVDVGTDGVTVAGAEGNVTTVGGGDAIKITWTAVPGASAYAVFVGTATGAANQKAECVVTQTSVTLTSLAGTGQAASALTGTSADANAYDGIIPLLNGLTAGSASGAYIKNAAGKLTGSNGEIVEVQDMFQSIWDTAKIDELRLLVSGLDSRVLTRLGITQDAIRVVLDPTNAGQRASIQQGAHIGSIMNSVTGKPAAVEVQPWLPGGSIIALPTSIPYNDANAEAAFDMVFGYDWERQDYAQTSSTGPIFEFETRCFGVLRDVFPGGCGLIYNIFKG